MKRVLSITFLLLCIGQVIAQHPSAKKIDSLLAYYESQNEWMGAVTLTENGKVIFEKAYGYSDVAQSTKASARTKYKIGSVTKMFTASVIFQLIDSKKLTLETPLSKFYPAVPNADKITIGQLLSHRSGIFNYTDDPEFMSILTVPHSKAELLARISKYPEHFAPGTKAEYSNSNYILLGYIIEDVTGKSYWDNVKSRIVDKLGLKNTVYGTTINPANNEAFSYVQDGSGWRMDNPWDMSLAGSAGAIVTTTNDLATFVNALFTGKIVSKSSLETMMNVTDSVGYGMFQVPFYDKKGYGHNGRIEEFVSQAYYFPAEKLGLTMVANAKGENNNDIAIGILSYLFNKDFNFPNLDKTLIDQNILDSYAGTYSSLSFPLKITINGKEGILYAQATGQQAFPLEARSETEFVFKPAGVKIKMTAGTLTLFQGGGEFLFNKE
jgi:CubicO group peptidase (beta-lactamase class C family)